MSKRRQTVKGLPGEVREYLLTGHCLSPEKPSEDECRQYWEIHRDDLTSYWLQDPDTWVRGDLCHFDYPDPAGPCHRPMAFWNIDNHQRQLLEWTDILRAERDLLGQVHYQNCHFESQRLETEFQYLHRNNLLTVTERRWLKQYPHIEYADWCLLFRKGWHNKTGRTEHIRMSHRCLTSKGQKWARLDLSYWDRLDLKAPLPATDHPSIYDVGFEAMSPTIT
jgi:hypothetical protein